MRCVDARSPPSRSGRDRLVWASQRTALQRRWRVAPSLQTMAVRGAGGYALPLRRRCSPRHARARCSVSAAATAVATLESAAPPAASTRSATAMGDLRDVAAGMHHLQSRHAGDASHVARFRAVPEGGGGDIERRGSGAFKAAQTRKRLRRVHIAVMALASFALVIGTVWSLRTRARTGCERWMPALPQDLPATKEPSMPSHERDERERARQYLRMEHEQWQGQEKRRDKEGRRGEQTQQQRRQEQVSREEQQRQQRQQTTRTPLPNPPQAGQQPEQQSRTLNTVCLSEPRAPPRTVTDTFSSATLPAGNESFGHNSRASGAQPSALPASQLSPPPPPPPPRLVIYTAPKPFAGSDGDKQRRAIRSWLHLKPTPRIILLGVDAELPRVAAELGVEAEHRIDTNFLGVPLFNSMVARAYDTAPADGDAIMLINSDIVLLPDVVRALRKLDVAFRDWFAVGARWDVEDAISAAAIDSALARLWSSAATDSRRAGGPGSEAAEHVHALVHKHGTLHSYGGMDFFAWRHVGARRALFAGSMPPFVFGRGKYDNWFTHEVIAAGTVDAVVDLSEAVQSLHVRHRYGHVQAPPSTLSSVATLSTLLLSASTSSSSSAADVTGPPSSSTQSARDCAVPPATTPAENFWSVSKRRSWEVFLNVHLSLVYGTYRNQRGSPLHAPYKLVPCELDGVCILRRRRPALCNCEYSNFAPRTQSDPVLVDSKWYQCGGVSVDEPSEFQLPTAGALTHTMHSLLPRVARAWRDAPGDAAGGDADARRVIVMTAASYEYRHTLMNWVCNLRRLGVRAPLVVALDENLYRYAFARGVAVMLRDNGDDSNSGCTGNTGNTDDTASARAARAPSTALDPRRPHTASACEFGTTCFRARTKLKSRHVLRVLRAGYDVLWSDVDIVWLRDARVDLHRRRRPDTIQVQSNEPDDAQPANGHRRINSGFYLAPSTPRVVDAFARIVAHAAVSQLSEQPSFYDVLCGVNGEYRGGGESSGTDDFISSDRRNNIARDAAADAHSACWHPTLRVRTELLHRDVFVNGARWDAAVRRVRLSRRQPEAAATPPPLPAILHNNWISGIGAKEQRQRDAGFIFWDRSRETCVYESRDATAAVTTATT